MKSLFSHRAVTVPTRTMLGLVAGGILMRDVALAAPQPLPPTLPKTSSKGAKPAASPVRKPVAKATRDPFKALVRPKTGSRLTVKPAPRVPSRTVATGRANPDAQSLGLADERALANANAPVLTLEDALAITLADNPARREAQAAINQAIANIGAVGAQGKFQVGLNGTTEYGRNTSTSNALAQSGSSGSSSSSNGNNGGDNGGNSSQSASSPSRSFLRFDQISLSASQPITSGGRVSAATRQARYQAIAQILQVSQVEQDLILSTTLGYLDVLRSQQLLRVTNSNLAVSQERLRIAQLRYSVGASARLDVLQAQTALADARSRRIQAANALGTANAALNTFLGRAPETPIRIAPITRLNLPNVPLAVGPSSAVPPSSPSGVSSSTNGASNIGSANQSTNLNSSTGTALGSPLGGVVGGATGVGTTGGTTGGAATGTVGGAAGTGTTATGAATTGGAATSAAANLGTGGVGNNAGGASLGAGTSAGLQTVAAGTRQSLAVTQAQIGAAEAAIDVAKAGKKPQLGLNLGALLRNPATFLGHFGASIGLGLAQNLFDSRRTRSQVDEARAALEQLKARLAGQRLEVANAIDASLLALDSAQRRESNSLAGVQAAREALRVAQLGFRSGVRTTLDLADAQAALLAAETDAVNARFDVADAQATLAAAVGIYTEEAQAAHDRAIRAEQDAAAQLKHQTEILQPKKKRKKFLGIF